MNLDDIDPLIVRGILLQISERGRMFSSASLPGYEQVVVFDHLEHMRSCGLLVRTGKINNHYFEPTAEVEIWIKYALDREEWADHYHELENRLSQNHE
jgi:hypothetical protein